MDRAREEVEPAAQRPGDGLRLEVVVEGGEITPAGVAAQLDQARAEHDAEDQPAEQPEDRRRRWPSRERARVEQRDEEDREDARLEQLDLPAVSVPVLADLDEGQVQSPEQGEQDRVREAREQEQREPDAEPRQDDERVIGDAEPEEGREPGEALGARAEPARDQVEEAVGGQQPVVSDQRQDLRGEREEGKEVDASQQPQDQEAREPVGRPGLRAGYLISEARWRARSPALVPEYLSAKASSCLAELSSGPFE